MKIVIIEPLGIKQELLEKLTADFKKLGHTFVCYDTRVIDEQVLIERGRDADVIIVANLPLNANVIHGFKNLKYLDVAFTGVDHIDLAACKAQHVLVSNASGYSTVAVSELVFGLIIGLYRNLAQANQLTRNGKNKQGLTAFEIAGKTMGILGTGAIGLRVAAIANAFGANVIAYSRTVKDVPYITYVDQDTLFKESDIVSIHLPLNNQTRNLVTERAFNLMKPNALLINTARGPIVNQKALVDALIHGKIAGAGIDVYDNEPPLSLDNPLLKTTNTILTPHIGFYTQEALIKRAEIVFKNLASYLDGHPINLINF